jgi:hypothetical protein
MVMSISPVAVQAGTAAECEIASRYSMQGAYKVFVTGTGVTATVVPAKETAPAGRGRGRGGRRQGSRLTVRFEAAADALPGVRDVRIATPRGASTLGQLVVVRDPVVREAPNNDTLQTAQSIPLPAAVCGAIEKREDVDYYKFKVAAGTALTFHVRCQRLENRIHDLQEHADPILTLRNGAGTVLAANDNYFAGDPLLHHRFPTAGEYYLEIRDTRYGGNPYWQYCVEINDRPFVTHTFPPRVTPGKPARLRLVGYNLPADASATLTLPADTPEGTRHVVLSVGGRPTNPVPVLVSRLPEVVEADADHATPATAQPLPVPCGVSGRIGKEGEADCYAFDARAGERFCFEVVARANGSALDSNLRVLDAKGRALVENDDARDRFVHADSRVENWAAPAAGRYFVEVRDLHERGGPEYVYFLKLTRAEPGFSLELDTDKTPLTPGTAGVIFARLTRHNGFAGEVQLAVEGLPSGVTATCGRILADGRDGCIILQAAPDAKHAAANLRVTGTAAVPGGPGKTRTLTVAARPLQEIYMPGGGRAHFPADMHTLSVGAPLDLKSVTISPTSVTLKPGESKRVEVTIQRQAGFKGNVTLDTVYQHLSSVYGSSMPAGVRIDDRASRTLLTGDQVKGLITLKAAPDAKPVKDQLVPVMAHVSINFVVKYTYCGPPLRVTVTK